MAIAGVLMAGCGGSAPLPGTPVGATATVGVVPATGTPGTATATRVATPTEAATAAPDESPPGTPAGPAGELIDLRRPRIEVHVTGAVTWDAVLIAPHKEETGQDVVYPQVRLPAGHPDSSVAVAAWASGDRFQNDGLVDFIVQPARLGEVRIEPPGSQVIVELPDSLRPRPYFFQSSGGECTITIDALGPDRVAGTGRCEDIALRSEDDAPSDVRFSWEAVP